VELLPLWLQKKGENAVVKVSDTGIGIREKDQHKLFTKFFRADEAKRLETDGTGLGLFIVKSIIEKHNGSIQVVSAPKKGTSFICNVPKVNVV
jgi:signal transduction histidine kinase